MNANELRAHFAAKRAAKAATCGARPRTFYNFFHELNRWVPCGLPLPVYSHDSLPPDDDTYPALAAAYAAARR